MISSAFCTKILERMCNRLLKFLNENTNLVNNPNGFHEGHSTLMTLLKKLITKYYTRIIRP